MSADYEAPGNRAPAEVYAALQTLADAGHITLLTVWCSEVGSMPNGEGHFHGQGAVHLPETFAMNPLPGEGVITEIPPPVRFTLPLRDRPPITPTTSRRESHDND